MEKIVKTFREIAIEESKDNFWHLTYRGKSEGYFVIKAKTKEDAEKYFEEEKHELFKNASGIYVDNIEKAEKYEEEYVINESDEVTIKALSPNGHVLMKVFKVDKKIADDIFKKYGGVKTGWYSCVKKSEYIEIGYNLWIDIKKKYKIK